MRSRLNTEIGKRIRAQREKIGCSREELAERVEISSRFLADIELGTKGMSFQTLIRLANELHVSTDYLLRGTKAESGTATIHQLIAEIDSCYFSELEQMLLAYQNTIEKAKNKTL